MTPTPLLPPVERRLTRWESLRAAVATHPVSGRHIAWIAPLVITVLAAVLRLTNLAHPHALAFDETFYVKDGWSMWLLGYEGTWGDAKLVDPLWVSGETRTPSAEPQFVQHPPLGKWIIGFGMALFGTDSAAAWRLTTALIGTATVLVVYLLARRLSGSVTVASIAGLLIAIDGLSIAMSRTAILDAHLTFFIVLGFLFLLYDRDRSIPRIEARDPSAPDPAWGVLLWRRPWVLACGVALGAATAVKWSGVFALAAAGIYLVVTDALARRRAGVLFWPTDAAFRQGPISFLLLVPAAFLTYLASWSGWFLTSGGYDRHSDPNTLVALWKYHVTMYNSGISISSPHPYASAAWEWPLLLRPTAVWSSGDEGCPITPDNCMASITTLPNPLIWYAGVAAAIYLLYRLVRGLVNGHPAAPSLTYPLVGLAATYLPWLMYANRTIFQFYTVAMMPFLVVGLAVTLREIAGKAENALWRRQRGERLVVAFLVAAVALSAFFYPLSTGMSLPYQYWYWHAWIPGWI